MAREHDAKPKFAEPGQQDRAPLVERTNEPAAFSEQAARGAGEPVQPHVRLIENQLKVTREELSSTIAQLTLSNEKLKASNEEVISANEELQSANEKLDTSKEELQRLNEELNATNQRLHENLGELERANNDLSNLLTSGNIATLFLDRELRVRRFTPAVTKLFSLADRDIGRPICDVPRKFTDEHLISDARAVLLDLVPISLDMQAGSGEWYTRSIFPYRTRDNRIEGVVITYSDITKLKHLADALRASEQHARWQARFPEENPNPVLRVSADGIVLYRNSGAARHPGWQCEVGQPLPQPQLRHLLGQAITEQRQVEQDIELSQMYFAVAVVPVVAECYANIYGRDVTSQKLAVDALRQSEQQVRHKLASLLDPDSEIGELELSDLLDVEAMQSLMDEFYAVARIPMSVIDTKGRVLVGVGWQDICINFHRANSQSCRFCRESDVELSAGLTQGEVRLYKCKNNMWDMATPIVVAGQQIGNIFSGQFFFDGEAVDHELFRGQARNYGFDEQAYLAALDRVPRLSRETIDHGMAFFLKLADTLSQLGYSNVKLARLLAERDRLANSLRQAKESWERTFEAVPDLIAILDTNHRVLQANRAMSDRLGLTADECVGLHCFQAVHGADCAPKSCPHLQTCMDGREHTVEIHEERLGGDFLVTTTPLRDENGAQVGSVHIARDITPLKRAQEELRALNSTLEQRVAEQTVELRRSYEAAKAERQRLYDVLETLPVYVILLTEDYHVPFANRFFEQRFGKSGGKRCYEYLFNRTEPCETCQTYSVLKTGQPHHWEWTGPDGRTYDIYDFPFKDTDGSRMIMEVGIDITETKQAQDALREANETLERRVAERTAELARSNDDLQQFAYAASHDLKEPLRVMSGFVELLRENYHSKLGQQADRWIRHIADGSLRMARLIDDLLTYSRVDRQGQEFAPVDLAGPARDALANLRAAIAEAKAVVEIDSLPTVPADRTQMVLLFQNLIGNAVKFHGHDSPDQQPTVSVAASRQDDNWIVSVRDNGIGIEPSYHERIFLIFQRLHRRDEYPGTGIGLAICKRIVERHGGRIWVQSQPGAGATFCFSLPDGSVQSATEAP